jgi:hypothetical protein
MRKLIIALSLATLTLGTTAAATAPVQAAPYHHSQSQSQSQHWKFQKKGNYAYLNGHRGDRHRHTGWRYYNGYWFPPAAFVIGGLIFGTILGSILAHQR